MKIRRIPFILALPCLFATSVSADTDSWARKTPSNYANPPVSFEANVGQADSTVAFLAHGQNGNLLLTDSEVLLTLQNDGKENGPRKQRTPGLPGQNLPLT